MPANYLVSLDSIPGVLDVRFVDYLTPKITGVSMEKWAQRELRLAGSITQTRIWVIYRRVLMTDKPSKDPSSPSPDTSS
jgi:hypothetical protein